MAENRVAEQGADKFHDAGRGASRTARMLVGYPMVAALLAIHFALAVTSVMNKCSTAGTRLLTCPPVTVIGFATTTA